MSNESGSINIVYTAANTETISITVQMIGPAPTAAQAWDLAERLRETDLFQAHPFYPGPGANIQFVERVFSEELFNPTP